MKVFKYDDTKLCVFENGSFSVCRAGDTYLEKKYLSDRPNFEVNLNGGKALLLNEHGFVFQRVEENDRHVFLFYDCVKKGVEVTVELDFSKGKNVVTQKNTIKNYSKKTVRLTRFSSTFLEDIGRTDEENRWYEKEKLKFYICHNKWQGEGQWKSYSASELGIYPTTKHFWERESFRIQSVGSWSTANFYPLVIVEDEEAGQSWFLELEGSHSWMIKLAAYGGYERPQLTMEATGCEETNGNWFYDLSPDRSYHTERAIFGTISGGFEQAAAALHTFKREDSLIRSDKNILPVVFNDYMDCVWEHQNPEALLPLIEQAAKIGCEIFCIDGGWCENENGSGLGDWLPKQKSFSEISLEMVVKKIRECDMIPGIWFEWEACEVTSKGYVPEEDWVLKRHGEPVGESRGFYNFKNQKVRDYLKEKVRFVYDIGIRYIKNDYNQSLGIGCTNNYPGESPAQGLIENCEAFYEFIEELYQEFPELIIENCGSGAMRSDHKTLRYFALQSISDQELYQNNPSILMGSLLQYPPEKAGIWAYPYPVMIDEACDFKLTKAYIARMADGKQTVFNMVTAMMGVLYLSGRIDLCDEKNEELIKEAVCFYKKNRGYIGKSRPIYPLGMHNINQRETAVLGLLSEDKLLLAIWNLKEQTAEIELNLKDWILEQGVIDGVYPKSKKGIIFKKGILKLSQIIGL